MISSLINIDLLLRDVITGKNYAMYISVFLWDTLKDITKAFTFFVKPTDVHGPRGQIIILIQH